MRQWLGQEWQRAGLFWLLCGWLLLLLFALAPGLSSAQALHAEAVGGTHLAIPVSPAPLVAGSLSGLVLDDTQAAIPGAMVTLQNEVGTSTLQVASAEDGSFVLEAVPSGVYRVRVEREGFGAWEGSARVTAGQRLGMGNIALGAPLARATIEVRASRREIAEAQMEMQEHQRVLGVFPNFYASYAADPEPLSAGQKLRLAWRFATDPTAFAMAGIVAGAQQGDGSFAGYGGGPRGYLRRTGATYADGLTSTLIGQAALPILFRQDPRYFVKGTGSVRSRILYAMASTVICRGDNRRWQMNYSNVLGNLFAAGLSNAYYPTDDRGAGLLVQNGLVSTALGAVGGLFQEFLLHRMTPGTSVAP